MGKQKPPESKPPAAPGWIVSFADMITNLMTFFILLCAFAQQQEAGLVADGIGSFVNVLSGRGGPGILGGNVGAVDLGATRVRYRPADAVNERLLDEPDGDIPDSNRDALRDAVKEAAKKSGSSLLPMQLIFAPGETDLSAAHRSALDIVAPILAATDSVIRIEGYAYAEPCEDIRTHALKRAESSAAYLRDLYRIDESRLLVTGYGSSGQGMEKHKNRVVQDRLGRRIVVFYLVPKE